MNITINRNRTNHLYTQGTLTINGKATTHTVEATQVMLPPGVYTLKIVKYSERRQKLHIFTTGKLTPWTLCTGHSWISSLEEKVITIGEPLIPGCLYRASPVYARLMDRLSKCQERKEPILLLITQDHCKTNTPLRHWLAKD